MRYAFMRAIALAVAFAAWTLSAIAFCADVDSTSTAQSEQRTAAEAALKAVDANYRIGRASYEDVYRWSRRAMNAELDQADDAASQLQAVTNHLKRMTELRDRIQALAKNSMAGGTDDAVQASSYYVATIKRQLEELDAYAK